MMKKIPMTSFLFLFLGGLCFAQTIDQTVARVRLTKPEAITQRQLRQHIDFLESQTRQTLPQDERRRILDLQVGEILINQAAARDNVRVNDDELAAQVARYKDQIAPGAPDPQFRTIVQNQMGMSWDEFTSTVRKRLVQEKYIMDKKRSYFQNIKDPTAAQVQQVYEANATDFTNPQLVRFNQVFFSTRGLSDPEKQQARKRADEAVAELRTSQFKDVVLKYSDDTNSKYKGGDAGYLARNDQRQQAIMGRNFFDTLFAMNLNQTSGVIESNVGYHIVQISEKRDPRLLGLKDPVFPGSPITVEERIKDTLNAREQQRTFQKALTDIIEDLKKDAEVTIYEQYLTW
jgi:parvulin-like peptidyl-prolyl isomerase